MVVTKDRELQYPYSIGLLTQRGKVLRAAEGEKRRERNKQVPNSNRVGWRLRSLVRVRFRIPSRLCSADCAAWDPQPHS